MSREKYTAELWLRSIYLDHYVEAFKVRSQAVRAPRERDVGCLVIADMGDCRASCDLVYAFQYELAYNVVVVRVVWVGYSGDLRANSASDSDHVMRWATYMVKVLIRFIELQPMLMSWGRYGR